LTASNFGKICKNESDHIKWYDLVWMPKRLC
jgi:hypothetical protein